MNRYIALTLIFVLILTHVAVTAEDIPKPSTISGQVVDMDGNPIPNFSFMIASVDKSLLIVNMLMIPVFQHIPGFDKIMPDRPKKITTVQSDADGYFNDISIPPGFIQLVAIPHRHAAAVEKAKKMEPPDFNADGPPPEWGHLMMTAVRQEKRITAIQTTDVTLFLPLNITDDVWDEGTLRFKLPPRQTLENVKIKVQPIFELQIRIVDADDTPIANAAVDFSVDVDIAIDIANGYNIMTEVFTDADGYFTYMSGQYGMYTISAHYDANIGVLPSFRLDKKNDVPKNLVIKLGDKLPPEQQKPQEKPIKNFRIEAAPLHQELEDGVWIVNPANGHAYKKITCSGWHDAQRKAIEQDAHLVSINDQAEQIWVSVIFGENNPLFWIGLNDVQEKGKWQWDSGEPVTFTYWSSAQSLPTSPILNAKKNYAVMGRHHGAWETTVSPQNGINALIVEAMEAGISLENNANIIHMFMMIQHAVIEKDGRLSKTPIE